ncbi:hypothetical protein [Streptomyces poriticola]|uniref:hypothetical protein n=1 Tax=Streptomyces poriticola TaxID=3120506 RepID=UPI002FCE28D3
MADLEFSPYAQGPLGEAITTVDTMGTLPPPAFKPSVTLLGPGEETDVVRGPDTRLLGPGDVAGLAPGCVLRSEPASGATDVEPNYLASVEVTPAELPWVLTPARANEARLRPWMVLVVLEKAGAPLADGPGLPFVEADLGQLPDLRDSWGWAHVQFAPGEGMTAGGGVPTDPAVARLVCPRRLAEGVTYRACLVPAFDTGVAAGLLGTAPGTASDVPPHKPAWNVDDTGSVALPVYHEWSFTTGPAGDFEQLVTRLQPADPESLRVSAARPVDVRAPWPGSTPLSDTAQTIGVQGALVPFADPPEPAGAAAPDVTGELVQRLRAQLDAPAQRLLGAPPDDRTGALAPPLYGARHVSEERLVDDPAWIGALNTSVANRIAAGLGAQYVRDHQEDLMAKAWEQVGAIREANRRHATVELTTAVTERMHERHVAPLQHGEVLALVAPAQARLRTSDSTTLSMELHMSRLTDGVASSAFARRLRPGAKLARRSRVSMSGIVPRGLEGEVDVPAGSRLVPATPPVDPAGSATVMSRAAAGQLMVISALADVASVNGVPGGADLQARVGTVPLVAEVGGLIAAGDVGALAEAIAGNVGEVTVATGRVLSDMTEHRAFGDVSEGGVPIAAGQIAGRVRDGLIPGASHWHRLASQISVHEQLAPAGPSDPVMACPRFPVPTALALLDADPEWFMPGLSGVPANRVALLRQNSAFIESYLVGINHEMMRELLWREYPTDRRGTPFTTFWPRLDEAPDIEPLHTWTGPAALGDRLLQDEALAVLLVRGDVLRRYPGTVVTAVRSGPPDAQGRHRPLEGTDSLVPSFVIQVDAQTHAYAFAIPEQELLTPASPEAPGWFFVFAENGYRMRFGFDAPPDPPAPPRDLASWSDATWPAPDGSSHPTDVPVVRSHAIAGLPFGPPGGTTDDQPRWNRDAADIARITLQKPFRVAVQADLLVQHEGGA